MSRGAIDAIDVGRGPIATASTPAGAHMRIVVPLELGFDTAFPVEGDEYPVEFSADVVREVWVRGTD
jgi:hypothetical protein